MTIDSRSGAWSSTTRTDTPGAIFVSSSAMGLDWLALIGAHRKSEAEGATGSLLAFDFDFAAWASTTRCTIARPRPVPSALVVWNG